MSTQNISDVTNLTQYSEMELTKYLTQYTPQEIFTKHQDVMQSIWNTRIEFIGNDTITNGIYTSYYNLLNAIRADYAYSTSPGGLVSDAYEGHTFWDCSTWMFPTLALIYPSTANSMLRYRLDRIYPAQRFAKQRYNFSGNNVMFPWESAFTGQGVCIVPNLEDYEQHITADIIHAVKLFYLSTHNDTWYFDSKSNAPYIDLPDDNIKYNYWNLSNQSCNFLGNRFVKVTINESYYYYTINDVVPPDESAGNVNSSIYTNVAAALVLQFCLNMSSTHQGLYVPPETKLLWNNIIQNVYLPESNKLPKSNGELLHKEYESYNGQDVNQADVALLQYPLQYFDDDKYEVFIKNTVGLKQELVNDLIYYQLRTTQGNTAQFFTGDSSYSIAWLRLSNVTMAQSFFDAAFSHMDINHFYLFRETLTKNNGGHLNFLTGVGGLLQNALFGYAGAHLTNNYLYFNPQLPLLSASNITKVIFHNINYRGVPFTLQYDDKYISFQLNSFDDVVFDEYFVNKNGNVSLQMDTLIVNYSSNSIKIQKTYTLSLDTETIVPNGLCRIYVK